MAGPGALPRVDRAPGALPPMRLVPRTLQARVFLLYAVALTLALATGLAVIAGHHVRREIQLAHQQSATLIDVLAQSVADALRSGDREALRRVLNAAVAQSAFGEVRFQERNGRELVAVAPVPDEPAAAAPAPLAGWIRERLNGHDRTIAVRGQDRGVLRAQPAVDEVVTQVWLAVQRALWLGALALAAGLVLMRVLLARWLAPLGRMARFVEQAGGSPAASIAAGADEPEEIRHALAQAASAAGGLRDRFGRRIQALDRALLQQRQAIDRVLMVVELSADGAIVSVNDLFCEVAGWSREEAIGRKDLWSLAADRYRDLARAAPRSPSWVGEVACRRRDGSLLWVKRTAVPFDGPQEGAAGGLLCLDVDITRRKAAEQRAVEEKERAEVTLQALAEGVIRVDAASRVAYANLAAQRLLGLDAQALQGRPLEQVFSLDLSGEADQTSASGTHSRFVITLHDGRQLTVELSRTSLLDAAGQPAGDVVAFRDVTQEQRIRHELQRLSLAVRHAASGIMITDAQGRIEYVNPRFTELTGFELDEVRGQTPRFLKSGETPVAVYDAMWRSLRSGQSWRGELVNRRRNGSLFWCSQTLASVLDGDGRATECVAVMEDVTERKEAEATIHRLAYYDALTDLPNRRMFMERAVQDVRHAREQGLALAACYLDLDGFKNVNDTLGHQVGDVLLAEVARRIRGCLSARDFLGRLGGDEFALLLHDAGSPDAVLGTGRRIIELLEEVFVIDDNEIFISTSIGVAMYPDDGQDVADLLRKADMALYEAKEMGKRKVMPFTAQLEAQRQGRARLEQALRDAVPRQELRLVYQPKVDMSSNAVIGCEALLRWQHPELGLLSPDRFVPLAEETRLIVPMGRWILQEACRQIRRWNEAGLDGVNVAVNISPVQFRAPELAADIERIVRESGIRPSQLEIEITESGLMEDPAGVAAILVRLRAIGLTIAIDDFGTGYSSLAYLKSFPVGVLKVDRSFVRDLERDVNDRGIAEAVISMARVLRVKVVAEGVETRGQLNILQGMGCQYGQGYFFSRPLAAADFERYWWRHRPQGEYQPTDAVAL
jgi:diguanylate cyclase (GGDEF)-like protein/PAS domain S-box-containing protein